MRIFTSNQPRVEVPYQERDGERSRCGICPHRCKLDEGTAGICGGRQVLGGRLVALNYARVCSLRLDPIEKKPLYHYFPGCDILSVGPNGCNLSCVWCQNWSISQSDAPTRIILPGELADMVDAMDGIGIAYTYAEPIVWFEYVLDCGRNLHQNGLVNVFVTNGYINPEPLQELIEVGDAFNIDLKTLDPECFRRYCGGRLEDVQRTIQMVHEAGRHLEITHLVVTGINDDLNKIERLAQWVADIDRSIPLHLSRYFPGNRYHEPPTSTKLLLDAYELACSKLDWVYLGNLWADVGQDSYCPSCQELLVKRTGFAVEVVGLEGNRCRGCGRDLNFTVDMPAHQG